MELSVVVPTLNGRDRLSASLDSLAEHAPDAEVVVVNGPSADGTTGMVRDREDVDVLVEVSARNVNVARNAGIEVADGEAIAILGHDLAIDEDWPTVVHEGLQDAPVVTGPTHQTLRAGMTTESADERRVFGREVTTINGDNVTFQAEVLAELDGFDEYLETGGAWDMGHRLAGAGYDVDWHADMGVRHEYGADGGVTDLDWEWRYRAYTYALVKNYGPRPTVFGRSLGSAARDAVRTAIEAVRGDATPTAWAGNGRDVIQGIATGISDGLVARRRDRSPTRNPHGLSARADRAVARYDWRTST